MQILWETLVLILFPRVNVKIQHMYGVQEISVNGLEYGYGGVKLFKSTVIRIRT